MNKSNNIPVSVTIITFDGYGVSGHANHIDTFRAVERLLFRHDNLMNCNNNNNNNNTNNYRRKGNSGGKVGDFQINGYKLNSVTSPPFKYILPLQIINIHLSKLLGLYFNTKNSKNDDNNDDNNDRDDHDDHDDAKSLYCLGSNTYTFNQLSLYSWLSCFNPFNLDILVIYNAMKCHKSQFVWYRRLFIFFSVYSYFNLLVPIEIKDEGEEKGGCVGGEKETEEEFVKDDISSEKEDNLKNEIEKRVLLANCSNIKPNSKPTKHNDYRQGLSWLLLSLTLLIWSLVIFSNVLLLNEDVSQSEEFGMRFYLVALPLAILPTITVYYFVWLGTSLFNRNSK